MVNKAILVGITGKDPEVRHLEGGSVVANFSLATKETYKDKSGERKQTTEWHNIVLWGKLAETAEKHIKKGQSLYIEGKITTRSWDDQNGIKRYTTEIVAQNLVMIPSARKESVSGQQAPPPDYDDMPF